MFLGRMSSAVRVMVMHTSETIMVEDDEDTILSKVTPCSLVR